MNALEQSEFLTTAAQVAVGLAGFTGVASVLSGQPTAVPVEVQSERLRAMIETALVAVVFSLVPLLLHDIRMDVAAVWRLSSALYLIVWAATFAITVRRGLRVLRGVRLHADRGWAVLIAIAGALTFLALLAGSLGFRPSSAYLFARRSRARCCPAATAASYPTRPDRTRRPPRRSLPPRPAPPASSR
jgi:hypothetical protein